ncbi:MAG: O-antigen ligase family protein [Bryobacteraceae bacterium]
MKAGPSTFERWLAVGLGAVLAWLVVSAWIPDQWPSNLAQAGIFVLVTAISVLVLFRRANATFRWILVPFLAAICWSPVQIWLGISVYEYATWTAALGWASYAGALWIALHVFVHADVVRQFRASAVVFGVVVAVEATLQKFASNGKVFWLISVRRPEGAMGPFLNYDHYAAFVELLLPIALWGAWKDRKRIFTWLCAAAVLYGSVIASASRAGSALATFEVLVILWTILRQKSTNRRSRVGFAAAAAALLVIATLTVGSSILVNRFAERDPLAFRRRTLLAAMRIIQARPWTGFGLGTWPTIYPAYSNYDEIVFVNHAHNDWAEWAGDGGIPFAVLMVLVALRAAWLCRRAPWGIGVVAVFVHSLVDFPLQRPAVMLWLVTILGCLESTRTPRKLSCDSCPGIRQGRVLKHAPHAVMWSITGRPDW